MKRWQQGMAAAVVAGLIGAAAVGLAHAGEAINYDALEIRLNATCRTQAQRVDPAFEAYFDDLEGMHQSFGTDRALFVFRKCLKEGSRAIAEELKRKAGL
jgi:hypothetical protein